MWKKWFMLCWLLCYYYHKYSGLHCSKKGFKEKDCFTCLNKRKHGSTSLCTEHCVPWLSVQACGTWRIAIFITTEARHDYYLIYCLAQYVQFNLFCFTAIYNKTIKLLFTADKTTTKVFVKQSVQNPERTEYYTSSIVTAEQGYKLKGERGTQREGKTKRKLQTHTLDLHHC